jgi:hypothetical protein
VDLYRINRQLLAVAGALNIFGSNGDLPAMTQQSSPATATLLPCPFQEIHDAVNALGGRPDQDNSYDQGIVDTVAKVLDIIEKAQSRNVAQTAPEPLSLQAVREDERMACWKIAEAERASAAVDKQAWIVAFDIANAIKARGYPLPSTDDR